MTEVFILFRKNDRNVSANKKEPAKHWKFY